MRFKNHWAFGSKPCSILSPVRATHGTLQIPGASAVNNTLLELHIACESHESKGHYRLIFSNESKTLTHTSKRAFIIEKLCRDVCLNHRVESQRSNINLGALNGRRAENLAFRHATSSTAQYNSSKKGSGQASGYCQIIRANYTTIHTNIITNTKHHQSYTIH